MPTPPPPDPRGVKYPFQGTRCYYAANKNPANNGGWTLAAELQFEMLHGNAGQTPSTCLIRELPAGTTAKRQATVNSEEALTGNGETGTLFCGAHVSVDWLVKIEAQPIGSSSWKPIFLGVIVKPEFDLDSCTILWHCEDYRYFMRKRVLYGRRLYDPANISEPVYVKGSRMTFNAGDRPDRYQVGPSLGDPEGTPPASDLPLFLPPDYNRLEANITPGSLPGPAIPGTSGTNPWADYWLAGHIWNYLRYIYCTNTPTDIAYLSIGAFVNWPLANERPPTGGATDYQWLFTDEEGVLTYCSNLCCTEWTIAQAVTALLHKCGPYDWTLVPNADGNTCDLVPFNTHEGIGTLDFFWSDYKQTVKEGTPDVAGGKLFRDRTDFYNRGYAVGWKNRVETSPTTIAEFYTPGGLSSLMMDATDADTTAWLAAYKAGSADVKKYPNVYTRFVVPIGYDWTELLGASLELQTAIQPVAFNKLISFAWAFDTVNGLAPAWQQLRPQVWRSKDSGSTWEALPPTIGVEIVKDACGIRLSDNARTGPTPWIWNGNADAPVVYDLLITIAVETESMMSATIDKTVSGDAAREYFLDGGIDYRPAQRINAYYSTTDGTATGKITTNNSTHQPVKIGTPASPVKFIDRQASLDSELDYRMRMKNAVVITGSLPLWGMRIDPLPLGYLLGTLTVSGDTPIRPELDLNSCIRGFRITRQPPETVLTLDGR